VYDDVTYVYDDVTYVYDDVTYVYDDVTYVLGCLRERGSLGTAALRLPGRRFRAGNPGMRPAIPRSFFFGSPTCLYPMLNPTLCPNPMPKPYAQTLCLSPMPKPHA
jgi:hypothetical protein